MNIMRLNYLHWPGHYLRYLVMSSFLFLSVILVGCGTNVKGYDDLREALTADGVVGAVASKGRFEVFEAVAAYEKVQILMLEAVRNPDTPDGLKSAIKLADREATTALEGYKAAALTATTDADLLAAKLGEVTAALGRAHTIYLQLIALGLAAVAST